MPYSRGVRVFLSQLAAMHQVELMPGRQRRLFRSQRISHAAGRFGALALPLQHSAQSDASEPQPAGAEKVASRNVLQELPALFSRPLSVAHRPILPPR